MAEMRRLLALAALMLGLCLTSCGSLNADKFEVDPDRANINEDSLDVVDPDKFNVDDDNNSLEDIEDNDDLDPETDVD
jgi:hypothetical protein